MQKNAFDMERSMWDLDEAIKNLNLLRDSIYRDLFAMERERVFMGTGYLMECCDAMGVPIRELFRIQEELAAGVDAAAKASARNHVPAE